MMLPMFISCNKQITPSLSDTSLSLTVPKRYNLNVNDKLEGSSYYWWSDNEAVAKVNESNGYVTAIGAGRTTVYCRIYTGKKELTLSCEVEVNEPMFFQYDYVAHALGGYEGNIYTNSDEALKNSLEHYKFMEVDMTLTRDDKLICSHGWDEETAKHTGIIYTDDEAPSYEEFISWKICGKYKSLDAAKIVEYMRQYPELLIEIDLKKASPEKTRIMIEQLVKLADNDEAILDRILMQFTSEEAYFAIEEVYSFKYYQYFTYKSKLPDKLDHVIKFCRNNNISSIAVNYTVLTDDMIEKIKSNGFYLLAFTIDDKETAESFLQKGVDTICTNFIR
jgi:glycerophosphoryl diester phosphodiesterase